MLKKQIEKKPAIFFIFEVCIYIIPGIYWLYLYSTVFLIQKILVITLIYLLVNYCFLWISIDWSNFEIAVIDFAIYIVNIL